MSVCRRLALSSLQLLGLCLKFLLHILSFGIQLSPIFRRLLPQSCPQCHSRITVTQKLGGVRFYAASQTVFSFTYQAITMETLLAGCGRCTWLKPRRIVKRQPRVGTRRQTEFSCLLEFFLHLLDLLPSKAHIKDWSFFHCRRVLRYRKLSEPIPQSQRYDQCAPYSNSSISTTCQQLLWDTYHERCSAEQPAVQAISFCCQGQRDVVP
jgi:hypothetical protein